jgi:hypothetical protein
VITFTGLFFPALKQQVPVFLFFGGRGRHKKGDTDPNFWRNSPVFFKNESPNFAQFLIFLGRVFSQACLLGYTFNGSCTKLSPVKSKFALKGSPFLLHYTIEEENSGAQEYGLLPEFFFSFLICSVAEMANLQRQIFDLTGDSFVQGHYMCIQ